MPKKYKDEEKNLQPEFFPLRTAASEMAQAEEDEKAPTIESGLYGGIDTNSNSKDQYQPPMGKDERPQENAVAEATPTVELSDDVVANQDALNKMLSQYLGSNYNDYLNSSNYAALRNQYAYNGQRAMEDTIGQLAARTGGMASSWAGSVGQGAYNNYMQQLASAAQQAYQNERSNQRADISLLQGILNDNLSEQHYQDSLAKAAEETAYEKEQIEKQNAKTEYDTAKAEAQSKIQQMRANGYTIDEIIKENPGLVEESGIPANMWNMLTTDVNPATEESAGVNNLQYNSGDGIKYKVGNQWISESNLELALQADAIIAKKEKDGSFTFEWNPDYESLSDTDKEIYINSFKK